MLNVLLSLTDVSSAENKKRQIQLEKELDEALDSGEIVSCSFTDHTYYESLTIDEGALRMFGGYVARRVRKISCAKSCPDCFKSLQAPRDQRLKEEDDIIHSRSKGYLIIPSELLMDTLKKLETSVLDVF